MEGDLLYEETKFNRSKRIVKTEKGYAGDSVLTQKQVEQGNLYIAQKNLVNKMKIFKIPQRTGIFIPLFTVLVHISLYCTYCFCSNTLNV